MKDGFKNTQKQKKIVCAAENKSKKGDCYLDDNVHYVLSEEMRILHTNDDGETWFFKTNERYRNKNCCRNHRTIQR